MILFLMPFSPYFGQGILGSGAKASIIADVGDDVERPNRLGTDRSAGRRLDAPNSRTVSSLPFIPLHINARKIAKLLLFLPTSLICYFNHNMQSIQRMNEKQAGRDARGLGFSNISQQAVVGTGQVRSKPKGQDGLGAPYYATGVGSSEEQFDRRSNFYSSKDVRPSGPVRLDGALLPTPSINSDRTGRPSSNKSWKHSEEEEYVWDDVHSQGADYGGNNTVRKGEWMADDENAKFANVHRAKWPHVGAVEHLDPNIHKLDGVPRFGIATDTRLAAYMVCEQKLFNKYIQYSIIMICSLL